MRFCVETLDGKQIAYASDPVNGTEFLVQVGLGKKGSYKTRYKVVGNLGRSVLYYNAINIGRGYKKRLIAPSFNKPLLARAWS